MTHTELSEILGKIDEDCIRVNGQMSGLELRTEHYLQLSFKKVLWYEGRVDELNEPTDDSLEKFKKCLLKELEEAHERINMTIRILKGEYTEKDKVWGPHPGFFEIAHKLGKI